MKYFKYLLLQGGALDKIILFQSDCRVPARDQTGIITVEISQGGDTNDG